MPQNNPFIFILHHACNCRARTMVSGFRPGQQGGLRERKREHHLINLFTRFPQYFNSYFLFSQFGPCQLSTKKQNNLSRHHSKKRNYRKHGEAFHFSEIKMMRRSVCWRDSAQCVMRCDAWRYISLKPQLKVRRFLPQSKLRCPNNVIQCEDLMRTLYITYLDDNLIPFIICSVSFCLIFCYAFSSTFD